MDADRFLTFWEQNFKACPPVSYLFKHRLTERWIRFHSLPGSKRYPEDKKEVGELLNRQNTVLLDLIGIGDRVVIRGDYSSSLLPWKEYEPLSIFNFQELPKISKQDFDPYEMEAGEEPIYLSLFFATHSLEWGSLDDVLLSVADWAIVNFFAVNCDRQCIFAPYDGGVDVILKNIEERDLFKEKYRDWLSSHPKGF